MMWNVKDISPSATRFPQGSTLCHCVSHSQCQRMPLSAIGLVELVSFHQFTKWTSLVMEKDKDWPDFGLIHHPLINFFRHFLTELVKTVGWSTFCHLQKTRHFDKRWKIAFFSFFQKFFLSKTFDGRQSGKENFFGKKVNLWGFQRLGKKIWRHSEKKCLEKFFWTELFWPFRQIFNSLKNYRILQLGLKRWVLKVAKLLYLLQSYGRNLL